MRMMILCEESIFNFKEFNSLSTNSNGYVPLVQR